MKNMLLIIGMMSVIMVLTCSRNFDIVLTQVESSGKLKPVLTWNNFYHDQIDAIIIVVDDMCKSDDMVDSVLGN